MTLTDHEVKIINGMIARGDNHHDIAAWFGVNQGRIAEVLNGDRGISEMAPGDTLPPKGPPGIKGRRLLAFVNKAIEAFAEGDMTAVRRHLDDGVQRFNRHE